jgi:hypothetical protein
MGNSRSEEEKLTLIVQEKGYHRAQWRFLCDKMSGCARLVKNKTNTLLTVGLDLGTDPSVSPSA